MNHQRKIVSCIALLLCLLVVAGPALGETAGATRANLLFIHHSVGEDWLYRGLQEALNNSGFHVADISYGWRQYGDHTDTTDWPGWFNDEVMPLVYAEKGNRTLENLIPPLPGENSIILFKSCFPCSEVGEDIQDEQAVYRSLLPYFASRPDKLFILITPPPMSHLSIPRLTRELTGWLTDRETGWLSGHTPGNVYVFDLYNVLTDPDAHHHLVDGREVHVAVPGRDTLHYDSNGDDHPNEAGHAKATKEFMGLFLHWHEAFEGQQR